VPVPSLVLAPVRRLTERSGRLALVLLELGLRPLDRVIVQLPNTAMFAYLYFALLRIGAPPVLALPGHRKREISQFASISGAVGLAVPAAARGFDFAAMAADVMTGCPDLRLCLTQGFSELPASPDDEVYLVDSEGQVVPDGSPGELIVRGPYTLRGYFRSPSTTPGRSRRTGSTGPVTCCGSCRPGATWSRGGSRT